MSIQTYRPVLPTEAFDWGSLPSKFLPDIKGNAGKVLCVSDDEKSTYWRDGSHTSMSYNDLTDKPMISFVPLIGNISLEDIGAVEYDNPTSAHPTLTLRVVEDTGELEYEF